MIDYRKELTEDILPFWLKEAIDGEYGGIMTCLDREGHLYGDEKSVWFQGRALWSFSKAYNVIEKDPRYLAAAKTIYEFLPKCEDTDGRMYFTVTRDGRGIQKRRYYFSETFAAIGCAEYYRASNDPEALLNARYYFDVAYDCFTGVRYTEPKLNPKVHAMKSLSPVMIMLSTAQTMRAIDTEHQSKYAKIAEDCLREILDGGYLTERALLEHISRDGKAVDTPQGRIVNPGHSMEAAWFILTEGLLTGNQKAIEAGKNIIDITLPMQLEWDMKLWWPQCETMIAARLAYALFGEETYQKLYQDTEKYCQEYFIDKNHGEWYGYLHYDNTPSTTLKGNIFKGPFHIPRLYMIMALLDSGASMETYMQ